MEIKVLEESKNKMEFEVIGESHTICTLIKDELKSDDHVKIATYFVDHPIIGKPHFIIETDSSTTPNKAIKEAIKRIKKKNEKILESIKKIK